jgi:hypothetical protein
VTRDPEIIIKTRHLDEDEEEQLVEDLTEIGYKREVIRLAE